jgi:hypothetical protein
VASANNLCALRSSLMVNKEISTMGELISLRRAALNMEFRYGNQHGAQIAWLIMYSIYPLFAVVVDFLVMFDHLSYFKNYYIFSYVLFYQ